MPSWYSAAFHLHLPYFSHKPHSVSISNQNTSVPQDKSRNYWANPVAWANTQTIMLVLTRVLAKECWVIDKWLHFECSRNSRNKHEDSGYCYPGRLCVFFFFFLSRSCLCRKCRRFSGRWLEQEDATFKCKWIRNVMVCFIWGTNRTDARKPYQMNHLKPRYKSFFNSSSFLFPHCGPQHLHRTRWNRVALKWCIRD